MNKQYAGFWDRINYFTIILILIFAVTYEIIAEDIIWSMFWIIILTMFLYFRHKFTHIIAINDKQEPITLKRRLLRFILTYIPLGLCACYAIFGYIYGQETITKTFGFFCPNFDDTYCAAGYYLRAMLLMQTILYPIPFLVLIYIID